MTNRSTQSPTVSIDPEVLEIQKKLFREQLMKQAHVKKGSKYYPLNIEPFALERERLALPFTDKDRMMRKQWLEDQVLSAREPVSVPEWTRVNFFRRAYRKPYDVFAGLLRPVIGHEYTRYVRWTLPKITLGLFTSWIIWYRLKYAPKDWEYGRRGVRVDRWYKPKTFPGDPAFNDSAFLTREFGMEDFEKRRTFLGDKLITSGP